MMIDSLSRVSGEGRRVGSLQRDEDWELRERKWTSSGCDRRVKLSEMVYGQYKDS